MSQRTTDVLIAPTTLLHIQAGSDTWEPSDSDLHTLETQFKTAIAAGAPEKDGPIVIATRSDVSVSVVHLGEEEADPLDFSYDDGLPMELDSRVNYAAGLLLQWQQAHLDLADRGDVDVYKAFSKNLRAHALTFAIAMTVCRDGDHLDATLDLVTDWYQAFKRWDAGDAPLAEYLANSAAFYALVSSFEIEGEDDEQDHLVDGAPTALELPVTAHMHHGAMCAGHAASEASAAGSATVDTVLGTDRLRTAAEWLLAEFDGAADQDMAAVVKIEANWYSMTSSRVSSSASVTVHAEKSKNVHARVDTMHVSV